MWPTWWWPQALMQPLILIFSSPTVSARSGSANFSAMCWAIGIARALARAQ